LKKKRKVAALQILESHSPEMAKQKLLVPSLDKPSSGIEAEGLPELLQEEIYEPTTELEPTIGSDAPSSLKK
jgi:hypothetical protein